MSRRFVANIKGEFVSFKFKEAKLAFEHAAKTRNLTGPTKWTRMAEQDLRQFLEKTSNVADLAQDVLAIRSAVKNRPPLSS